MSIMLCCGSALLLGCAHPELVTSEAGYQIKPANSSQGKNWLELRNERVVMQQFDYSCGAASLATLMRYYFNDDVTELDLVEDATARFSDSSMALIESAGLSFFEMEQLATARGYQVASVELSPDALDRLSGPVIVYLHTPNFRHFVVLRKATKTRVLLADPSRGNMNMSKEDFLKEWQGYTLILGKPGFGTPADFPLKPESTDLLTAQRQLVPHPSKVSPWMYVPR